MANSQDPGDTKARPEHRHALTTLRHRNFRLIWFGQLVSTVGGQMQQVAIAWHLFQMTDSSFQVGLVSVFGIAPFLVLSLVGGALADQFDRKKILLTTQTATMCVSSLLVIATVTDNITPTLIYVIAFMSGMTRSFDAPARQAMIPSLVPAAELGNALTLNTMLRQVGTIIGPGLGGLVLGFAGVSVTYALNTVSFLGIIGALLIMDPLPEIKRRSQRGLELALGGLRFVRAEKVVLSVLALDFLVNILGSTRALFPVFAADILHVGPEGLGLLYSAPAAGAVTGALIMGAVGLRTTHPAMILVTCATFGAFTIGFGLSQWFPVALIMLFGTGFADVTGEILRSTLVQLRTPDDVRGRVTSLTVIFTGGGPQLGQLQSGAIATAVGPMEAAVAGGLGVLLSTAAFCFNPHMRRRADSRPAAVPVATPADSS